MIKESRFTPPPVIKIADKYLDMHGLNYWTSVSNDHKTHHDWLRYYLHLLADRALPNRHIIYSSKEALDSTPIQYRGDIGGMPLASTIYQMMLEEHGLLFDTKGPREKVFTGIQRSLTDFFRGKNVFLVPGRSGQTASFLQSIGANIGLNTDGRYTSSVLSTLNFRKQGYESENLQKTKGISFVLEAKTEEILEYLADFRPDLSHLANSVSHNGKVIFLRKDRLIPDILISTNMFNSVRFNGGNTAHNVGISKEQLLFRILSLAVPDVTECYLIPSTEHGSAFTRKEIEELLHEFAEIKFYDPEKSGGASVLNTLSDFAMNIRLKSYIPADLC